MNRLLRRVHAVVGWALVAMPQLAALHPVNALLLFAVGLFAVAGVRAHGMADPRGPASEPPT